MSSSTTTTRLGGAVGVVSALVAVKVMKYPILKMMAGQLVYPGETGSMLMENQKIGTRAPG